MTARRKTDYVRLYSLATELHRSSTNHRVREIAAELVDLVDANIGQCHRPEGMRPTKGNTSGKVNNPTD